VFHLLSSADDEEFGDYRVGLVDWRIVDCFEVEVVNVVVEFWRSMAIIPLEFEN
jgi:hypothetical protein